MTLFHTNIAITKSFLMLEKKYKLYLKKCIPNITFYVLKRPTCVPK